jgi:hypothetical protein
MCSVFENRLLRFTTVLYLFFANMCGAQPAMFDAFDGYASSFSNDFIGDSHDRWRSASYQGSLFYCLPDGGLAEPVELRARAEIISPWTEAEQHGVDRPFVTAVGFGVFGHKRFGRLQTSAGAEVLRVGSETALADLQAAAHNRLDLEKSFDISGDDHDSVDNSVAFGVSAELAYQFALNENLAIRPFAFASGGAEQVGTFGADVLIGSIAAQDVWTRDVTTGRLMSPHAHLADGVSFVAGWDTSIVESSYLIPEDSNVSLLGERSRARAGVQLNGPMGDIFIGQAWLS